MPCIILLQFLLIADLALAVPDSRYRHEYKDNKLSVPKPLLHGAVVFQLELG